MRPTYNACLSIGLDQARPITHKSACFDKFPVCKGGGDAFMRCQRNKPIALAIQEAIIGNDQGIFSALRNRVKCGFKIRFPGRVNDLYMNTNPLCFIIQILQLNVDIRRFGIHQRRNTHQARRELVQDLKPLCQQLRGSQADAGDIAAGMIQATDKSAADRIRSGNEHDRLLLQWLAVRPLRPERLRRQ